MISGVTNSKNRRLPQRTCVACRRVDDKHGLIRLVRTMDGAIEVDVSGKKRGRGAYLCPNRACWENALKKNRLDYCLRTRLSDGDRQLLTEYSHGSLKETCI